MKNKIDISVERMIEIENHNEDILSSTNDIEELKYYIFSIQMPIEKIKKDIDLYDKSSPKIDELQFISHLQVKYNQSKENIFLRIRQVRKIMKYERKIDKKDKQKIKKK